MFDVRSSLELKAHSVHMYARVTVTCALAVRAYVYRHVHMCADVAGPHNCQRLSIDSFMSATCRAHVRPTYIWMHPTRARKRTHTPLRAYARETWTQRNDTRERSGVDGYAGPISFDWTYREGGGKKHEITITVIVTAYSVIFDYSRSVKYSGRSWIDPPGSLLHREESYPFSRAHRPLARRVMQVRFRNSAIRARRHSRGSHFYSYDRPRQF